jgi:serine/threonine protein kinase
MSFEIGETVGHYRITERLGQGGMATVYRARDVRLERDVALKVLHPAFKNDPSFNERFTREARIVANLNHDNIIPVFDTGEQDGQAYLVMRFIDGETLKARLAHGPLTVAETIKILDAVAGALDFAHKAGILHRDIKPSNIMLENSTGKAYLADFGLARMADAGESTMSQDVMLGTPHYISPEQAQGIRDLTAGTDIYSLGVVLYEIIVGRVPFMADTPYAIVHDHIFAPLPLPTQINPNVPREIENVLLRALAKDRNDRYASTIELAEAFKQAVQDSGMETLPSGSYRIPFPLDAKVTRGTTALDTPRPSTGNRPTIPMPGATPTPTALMTAGSTVTVNDADPVRSISELRRVQQRLQQRRNLWVFVGLAGLIMTCLAGTIVTVSAFADPLVRQNISLGERSQGTPFVVFNGTPPPGNIGVPPPALNSTAIPTRTVTATTAATVVTPNATLITPTSVETTDTTAQPDLSAAQTEVIRKFGDTTVSVIERDKIMEGLYKLAYDAKPELIFFANLVRQNQTSAEAHALLAIAQLRAKQPRLAERSMESALKLDPSSAYVLLLQGLYLKETGETDSAKKTLKKARDAEKASPWVIEEAKRLIDTLG